MGVRGIYKSRQELCTSTISRNPGAIKKSMKSILQLSVPCISSSSAQRQCCKGRRWLTSFCEIPQICTSVPGEGRHMHFLRPVLLMFNSWGIIPRNSKGVSSHYCTPDLHYLDFITITMSIVTHHVCSHLSTLCVKWKPGDSCMCWGRKAVLLGFVFLHSRLQALKHGASNVLSYSGIGVMIK